ncbi:MAG TPA: HEAT repeat domain-containing protein [Cyclobacteriaceae bacterium]|nr:HEAT repeat domain-containing protein [Cyclobacteriaceae bacterium]
MMEKDKLESLLIDYIDGQLNEGDRKVVEEMLREDPATRKLYDQMREVMNVMDDVKDIRPSSKVAQQFDAFLQEEIQRNKTTKVIPLTWFYRVAAAVALIVISGGIGYWISQQQKHEDEMLAMKRELEITRQLVMSRLRDEQSASQRILGVQAAYVVEETDHEIVDALIKVMNGDPNNNVRLAAIEALGKFNTDEKVRKALIASLSVQTDPVVQIALIQLMVQMKEKSAVKSLQEIIKDDKTLPAVKDEAYSGIFKLS